MIATQANTKYAHDNIPNISKQPADHYIHKVRNYKEIKNSNKEIENVLIIAEYKKIDITLISKTTEYQQCMHYLRDIICVHLKKYNILYLLSSSINQFINEINIVPRYQLMHIHTINNKEYSMSYNIYYNLDDKYIFTKTITKKALIELLTTILYLHEDIDITDINGNSYIKEIID